MARLVRGQTALSVTRRKDQARSSVQSRLDLFKQLIGPASLSGSARSAAVHFRTHVTLCQWHAPEHDITPVSANTLRKYVDSLFPGGWHAFEERRVALLSSLRGDDSRVERAPALRRRLSALAEEQHKLLTAVGMHAAAYQDCLERLGKLAKRHSEAERHFRAHTARFPPTAQRLRLVHPEG